MTEDTTEEIYSVKSLEFTANRIERKFEFSHGENAEGEEFIRVSFYAVDPLERGLGLYDVRGRVYVVDEEASYSRTAAEDVLRETLYALYAGLADELQMTAKEVASVAFDLCEFAYNYSNKF